jgi:hypothetical protein
MNSNIILLSYLLIKNKSTNIFKFDNYYWKLLCILYLNNLYILIKSKNFYYEYKI